MEASHSARKAEMPPGRILERSLRILSLFAERSLEMSVRELATLSGFPESTVYRYVAALRKQGLIEEGARPGYYCLGLRLVELSRSVKRATVLDAAVPVMRRLSRETGETSILCCIHGQKGICLEKVESQHVLRVCYQRGTTFYLHAGSSGKVLLAHLREEEQDAIIRQVGLVKLTERTVTDPVKLKCDLVSIRAKGFSVTDGEATEGVRAISAPIFDGRGEILASLSVGGPIQRLTGQATKKGITLVIEAAQAIALEPASCGS
jgi:DNA-binding IclR family transcriptional regulator